MSRDDKGVYVRRVLEDTREYLEDLLKHNEELQQLVTDLEVDKTQLEDRIVQEPLAHTEVERRLRESEKENLRLAAQFEKLIERNFSLANLYIASYQLHGTLDRTAVLASVREIIANMIGSEEMAVLEMDESGKTLSLVDSCGVEPARYSKVELGAGVIGEVGATGQPYLAPTDGETPANGEELLTACIPLKLDDRVVGAIAIFRLLEQKKALTEPDHELFDLLSIHVASALYCTREHSTQTERGQ